MIQRLDMGQWDTPTFQVFRRGAPVLGMPEAKTLPFPGFKRIFCFAAQGLVGRSWFHQCYVYRFSHFQIKTNSEEFDFVCLERTLEWEQNSAI